MLYEINNPDSFQVINKNNPEYEENLSLIDRFRDVRYSTSGWGSFGGRFHEQPWESTYVKQLFDLWSEYCKRKKQQNSETNSRN